MSLGETLNDLFSSYLEVLQRSSCLPLLACFWDRSAISVFQLLLIRSWSRLRLTRVLRSKLGFLFLQAFHEAFSDAETRYTSRSLPMLLNLQVSLFVKTIGSGVSIRFSLLRGTKGGVFPELTTTAMSGRKVLASALQSLGAVTTRNLLSRLHPNAAIDIRKKRFSPL